MISKKNVSEMPISFVLGRLRSAEGNLGARAIAAAFIARIVLYDVISKLQFSPGGFTVG